MQQKYSDHGRSTAPLTMTWPIWRARNSCGSDANPRNASILRSANSSSGFTDGSMLGTPRMSRVGLSPTWVAIKVSRLGGLCAPMEDEGAACQTAGGVNAIARDRFNGRLETQPCTGTVRSGATNGKKQASKANT